MRVLMVSRTYTHPHDMGNRQRVFKECLKMKSMGWEVDFLYIGNINQCDKVGMQVFFGKEHLFFLEPEEPEPKYQIKKTIRSTLDTYGVTKYIAIPYNADEWYASNIEETLYLLCRKKGCTMETINSVYDMVWVQYFFYSKFLEKLPHNIFKVIDLHDRFSYRNRMYQKSGKIPDFYYTVSSQERKALSRADVVISIQNQEEKWFAKLLNNTDTKVVTIGDVVDLNKSDFVDKKCYGFIGADNKPNELALEWFITNVLPHVKENESDSIFVIAGGICKKLKDSDSYIKLGRVDSVDEFYNNIRCSVNPTKHGTGLNIKSIEALSYCKPLVTTAIGAKGLASAEKAMLVSDEPKVFAENIVKLLNDDNACKMMQAEAEHFIKYYNNENERMFVKLQEMAEAKKKGEI